MRVVCPLLLRHLVHAIEGTALFMGWPNTLVSTLSECLLEFTRGFTECRISVYGRCRSESWSKRACISSSRKFDTHEVSITRRFKSLPLNFAICKCRSSIWKVVIFHLAKEVLTTRQWFVYAGCLSTIWEIDVI